MSSIFKNRQTIKPAHYTGEKIDDKVVEQLLDVAQYAPTHKLTEPWHFVVFAQNGVQRLEKFTADLYRKHTPVNQYLENKYQKYLTLGQNTSHIIAICLKRDVRKRIPETEEICAVACAVQNIHLACYNLGVAGYWSTGGATNCKEVNEFLGLTEKDKCLGFFYLGIPVAELPNRTKRTPISDKTKWIRT